MNEISISVYPDKEVKKQGDLFGIFFEDLNHAADGGLYGELIQNRSFEFDPMDNPDYHYMTAWETVRRGTSVVQPHIDFIDPYEKKNPHFLRVEVVTSGAGGGVRNLGYGPGIPIEKGKTYRFSCCYRRKSRHSAPVAVLLEDADGETVYGKAEWEPVSEEWAFYECGITADDTNWEGRLTLLMREPVTVDFAMVSLFPADTFRGRKNGLRKDIAEMLEAMKPAFMRFPGGCLAHIGSLDAEDRNSIYRWKNTLGPVESRPARKNNWNYNQTLGLGYFEYFQFCEDIGAEPLPVIPAGYDPHNLRAAPMDQMQEWIDEALDLIEFANGAPDTRWGAVRAEMGHPDSFHMKYLGIGNEEVGDEFFERYEVLLNAIKEKHPEICVLGSAGPGCAGSEYDIGWEQARRTSTDYMDEHFYQCPDWFIGNAERYLSYPEEGPKVFLGEYASQGKKWKNALAESVFMIGMEKAPAVGLACYAPMLCNVDYVNWQPDMLYFDNHRVYGAPSYYIQKLFMNYTGESLVETSDTIRKREKTKPSFAGPVAMSTRNGMIEVTDFVIENRTSGTKTRIPDFVLNPDHSFQECGAAESSDYTISFTFRKPEGRRSSNLEGMEAFMLEFARKDKENELRWTIDGWQRLASLIGIQGGPSASVDMRRFESDPDREHRAVVTVKGNEITTSIDGVPNCAYAFHNADPDPLYYSAVRTADEVMIKVANVEAEEKELRIHVPSCTGAEAALICIEGVDPEAENSFEEPERVSPEERRVPIKDDQVQYTMKGNSFCIFRVKIKEKQK